MKVIRQVAVVGATGMLGKHVTNRLVQQGYSVTAVVRNMLKGQQLLNSKVHLQKGDLSDPGSLLTAFRDVDYLYLNLSTGPHEKDADFRTEIEGLKNAIKAAKQARIKRIAYLSSLVKDYEESGWWVFDYKREAVRILREAEIPVTIFYPSSFYENLAELQIRGNRVMLAGHQTTKSWWIGTEDYARMVGEAFRQQHDEDREYAVQGPEPMNMDEAIDLFIQNCSSKNLKKTRVPMQVFKILKPFSKTLDFQYYILDAINNYDEKFVSERTWDELGRPQQTLADWAKQIK